MSKVKGNKRIPLKYRVDFKKIFVSALIILLILAMILPMVLSAL